MKITIYELLGMVKDGKAPSKIKYDNMIWEYDGDYYSSKNNVILEEYCNLTTSLNDEVEILEEEKKTKPLTKKDIEALGYVCGEIQKCFTNGWTKSLENKPLEEEKKIPEKISLEIDKFEDSYYDTALIKVAGKIDELIDYLDYLKSKGDE